MPRDANFLTLAWRAWATPVLCVRHWQFYLALVASDEAFPDQEVHIRDRMRRGQALRRDTDVANVIEQAERARHRSPGTGIGLKKASVTE
jgi:hypothetical protein